MSIATELAKLQTARNKIRTKLVALGLVAAAAKLDDCATAVDGISNQGAVSATVQEGDTYTIPAGYHNGSGTVSGVAGGGNYKLQSKTVAPTKAQQSVRLLERHLFDEIERPVLRAQQHAHMPDKQQRSLLGRLIMEEYTHTTGDMQRRAAEIVGEFLTDIFGEELRPWEENGKMEKELSA